MLVSAELGGEIKEKLMSLAQTRARTTPKNPYIIEETMFVK
jgi:hypothetical protein